MNKLSVNVKIWILVLVPLTISTVAEVLSIYSIAVMVDNLKRQAEVLLPATRASGMLDMFHDGIRATVLKSLAYPNERGALQAELEEALKGLDENFAILKKADVHPDVTRAYDESEEEMKNYIKEAKATMLIDDKMSSQERDAKYKIFEASFFQLAEKLEEAGGILEEKAQNESLASAKEGEKTNATSRVEALVMMIITLIFGWWVSRSIVSAMQQTANSLNRESGRLREVGTNLEREATKLSESTTEQAAAIEETVSSMEEMTAMLAQTTQHAASSLEITQQARNDAERGSAVVERMIESMREIQESNKQLERLENLIKEIESKTNVINDIVFETRLLSFNASIEAARAGVHGKGFAVVAEEVGKLAAMSGKAADEIRQLLESSTREVSTVVSTISGKVTVAQQVSIESGEAFRAVDSILKKINDAVAAIASASKEQETGIHQTNKAMNELDKTTQVNFQSMEILAGMSKSLAGVIDGVATANQEVMEMVGKKLDTKGHEKVVLKPSSDDKMERLVTSIKPVHKPNPEIAPEMDAPAISDGPKRNDSRWSA